MASLPVSPKASKLKPASVSARDALRRATNYGPRRFTGFAPIPIAAFAEIPRLSSGAACQQLLYLSLALSLGQMVEQNQPFKETTEERTTADWAELCGCDERTFQREVLGLAQRKVIDYKQRKKGVWQITPLFRSWDKLVDYKPGPTVEPETDDEPAPEDPAAADKAGTITRLTEKPVSVRAGGSSKKIKADCGISDIVVSSNLDIHFEAVVQGGSLHLKFIGPQFKAIAGNDLLKAKGIQANQRHGCRVEHHRAEEIGGLFDDALERWTSRMLSNDPVALQKTCQAAGNVPNDVLVKGVIERASRRIASPSHCALIADQIRKDWETEQKRGMKRASSVRKCSSCNNEPAAINDLCYGCAERELSA